MSEMVERLARAIERAEKDDSVHTYPEWARALLLALEDPTNDMANAGAEAIMPGTPDLVAKQQAVAAWRAMVNRAMGEGL